MTDSTYRKLKVFFISACIILIIAPAPKVLSAVSDMAVVMYGFTGILLTLAAVVSGVILYVYRDEEAGMF